MSVGFVCYGFCVRATFNVAVVSLFSVGVAVGGTFDRL
jgi:hypothetical protein